MTACAYGMIDCHTTHRVPSDLQHADMVSRLRAWRAAATTADVAEGSAWYSDAGRIMGDAAEAAGLPRETGAVVAAILSPRAPWDANVSAARAILSGRSAAGMTVLPDRVRMAESYVATVRAGMTAADALGRSPKVRPFACNLSGCTDCVTADVWYVRAATGRKSGDVAKCGCEHAAIAAATRDVAAEYGETPAALQAIVWVAIRAQNPARGRVRTVVPA